MRDDRPRLIANSKPSWPAMDRFESMRAVARVVETGRFTRAAHTLPISRPTVTP
ncbi:LysR family transcriptional regulator, partial [Stenotrophomonas maltophilia]